ncbi:MAG: glycosyltransferase [Verrucomicrobia bacterium]|nr:glycosyltransferase [Verrucomicrobiota bacterium]
MDIFHILVLGSLSLLLLNYLLNLKVFRFPDILPPHDPAPLISVMIPARNEEQRIRPCLETLTSSNYPSFEILVLDDHSTDGTAEIVRQHSQGDSRVHLISGQELPSGWTGKAWACHQLAARAKGEYLVFVDADTRFSDITLSHAVALARRERSDLLSLWPYLEAKSWSEWLVIPFVHLFILLYLPHWMGGRSASLGAANGQFLLFRREAYEKIGGHAAVSGHLVEDIALGRKLRAAGFRVLNRDGTNPGHPIALVRCRMYDNFRDLWDGFTKNLYPAFDGRFGAFVFFQFFQGVVFLGPFLLLPFSPKDPVLWIEIAVILSLRLALTHRFRQSWLGAFLHPVGQSFVITIAANSWLQTLRRRLPWRGRHYAHHNHTHGGQKP